MSFVVPTWVLWLQVAYSLWTFLRNAKFFRVPFISMSILWHGYDRTWFKKRKYLLLDGKSREGGGDWRDYDNDEEKESHSFSIENNYDMRFQLNNKKYRFCASFETGKPLKFLHFAKNYHLATEDIVLMGKYHLVKAVKPESMLKYILMGGTIKTCEEYCIVDNTSSELLNVNFMRILSIFPLVLQAKGYNEFSTLVSAFFVVMDIFSFYFNFVWQGCQAVTFQYTNLFLGTFNVKYRVFIHELLSTGSDSFMFCDDSVKKSYYKTVDQFKVVRGCAIPLEATTAPLPDDDVEDGDDEEIEMNLNNFVVQTIMVADGYYDITVTDRNNYKETRMFLSKNLTRKIIKYLMYCKETAAKLVDPVLAEAFGVKEVRVGSKSCDIRELISTLHNVSLRFIKRSANRVAYDLARASWLSSGCGYSVDTALSDLIDAKTIVHKVKVTDVGGYVLVKDHPCKIVGISTALAPEKQQFHAIDVFSGKKFKATFPLSGTCFVPIVTYTDYHLVDIDDDSYVTLIDDKGNMKYDLMLPTDKALVSQITVGIRERKDVFVSVVSAMGKEQIIASYALNRK
ncbi:hypothetical protein POM88_033178 [Heracleum sosnowskyi]|uniref:Translation initiation factor 5A C-terminal domain-containing protein n=1 Tax=Heracleum sosnowskyi TaxID=360622 RepID=A0AAD8I1L3_9APIA|nr:hypothetical protein POM88_033178 [Heracleum sosnowskyi]